MEFESLVIDWLWKASVSAVAELMGVSWNAIDGIMHRVVMWGLAHRPKQSIAHIGVDEIPFCKRHEYFAIVPDTKSGTVLHVGKGREKASLKGWHAGLTSARL